MENYRNLGFSQLIWKEFQGKTVRIQPPVRKSKMEPRIMIEPTILQSEIQSSISQSYTIL